MTFETDETSKLMYFNHDIIVALFDTSPNIYHNILLLIQSRDYAG